jgi:hypothetical protein
MLDICQQGVPNSGDGYPCGLYVTTKGTRPTSYCLCHP